MGVGQELIEALEYEQNNKITELLRRVDGRTVNETDAIIGGTPLHWACERDHVEAVAQLLAIPGVNVNARHNYGWTPIMLAAANGSIEAVKMLLQQPAVDVNDCRVDGGCTAVMKAAAYCKIEVLRLLGEHPAVDLDIRGNDGAGLEDVVGMYAGDLTEKSKCLDIIKEARRKRENTSQGQSQASAEEVRAEVIKHNIDQIDNANLKIRERENKIKADEEAKKEKMKVLQKKQDSEQKTITMKLNEEKRIFEEKKNNLEQQLATLQQRHNHEKTILEDNFKKEAENDRQLLASLKITTDQLVRDLGKLDLDLEPENDGAPSAPSAPSAPITPPNIEAAKNTLECPVCLEIMRPPTRIWMCSNSHLVCQECREKIEGRMCPTCRTERVDLRAHMAENFSMSLFNN